MTLTPGCCPWSNDKYVKMLQGTVDLSRLNLLGWGWEGVGGGGGYVADALSEQKAYGLLYTISLSPVQQSTCLQNTKYHLPSYVHGPFCKLILL